MEPILRIIRMIGLIAVIVGVAHQQSYADLVINEIFLNPPGADNGQEFVELRGTTGGIESMAGLTLIGIEGDGTAPGLIDFALNLGAFSTGTNGLFLWRDSASVINPAPDSATTINVADFSPDIENGSQTFVLVRDFTGTVAQDLDTNNDGVLDVTPWASVLDAVGLIENDGAANVAYAQGLGFFNYTNSGFNADVLLRDGTTGQWLATDVLGTNPGGPYTADPGLGRSSWGANGTETISPGNFNFSISAVPEPPSLLLAGCAALLGVGHRRRLR
jgi:hypothetical protein